jgi:hypothetical protein
LFLGKHGASRPIIKQAYSRFMLLEFGQTLASWILAFLRDKKVGGPQLMKRKSGELLKKSTRLALTVSLVAGLMPACYALADNSSQTPPR